MTYRTSDKQTTRYQKFLQLRDELHPDTSPWTDLCLTSQHNTSKVQQAANLSEEEKSNCVRAKQEPLNCAQAEREFNNNSAQTPKNHSKQLTGLVLFTKSKAIVP